MEGYIKLFRQLMENEIWKDSEPFCRRAAWVDLLLMANHEDHTVWDSGESIDVNRGEVNRSMSYLADRWHWSRGKVTRFLHDLEMNHMASIKRTGKRTAIIIENYSVWQDARTGKRTVNGQQTDTSRTVHGQLTDTYKNGEERLKMFNNGQEEAGYGGTKYKQVDRQTLHYLDGETVEIVRGVPQLTEAESMEMIERSHKQFAPIKARIAAEAEKRIKEREAKQ